MDDHDYALAVNTYSDKQGVAADFIIDCIEGVICEHVVNKPETHADMYEKCMDTLAGIYKQTGMIVIYQDNNENMLTESQYKELKKQIKEQYEGASQARRPLLLEGGLKIKTLDLSHQISALLKAANYHKTQMEKKDSNAGPQEN